MDHNELRQKYLDFFAERGHAVVPSAPLVPENDATTLFTGSGMQPLVPYLLGAPHPKGTRIVDSQKCFRSMDIEEVGDNRHTTFFEMLGNWSLGDYFKDEQLLWVFSFLTDVVCLDPQKLFVTVFAGDESLNIPQDDESVALWKNLFREKNIDAQAVMLGSEEDGYKKGIQGGRIFYYDAKKNWWSRSGVPSAMPAGEPGGPDSEIFYDFGTEHDPKWGEHCHPNCDCGRFLEIGNSVFMQYVKNEDGSFSKLPKQNVDFGGGLERMLMAATNTPDVVAVNHAPIIAFMEETTGKRYGDEAAETRAFRIVADHMKAAVFLISDGVYPANTDQGYFVRRLLRRAIRYADQLGMTTEGISGVVEPIVRMYEMQYPRLRDKIEDVKNKVDEEERKFRTTLRNGLKHMSKVAEQLYEMNAKGERGYVFSGRQFFDLYQTYGFPFELSTEELSKYPFIGFQDVIDDIIPYKQEFDKLMMEHREKSRAGAEQKFKGGLADAGEVTTQLHTCTHLMLAGLKKYLGPDVHQAGSNITAERTRFDFTYPDKVPRDILDKVEAYVNEAIGKHCPMTKILMKKEDAKAAGVEGSFWEKYPDEVNVYAVTCDDGTTYSTELCGGPHVENTSDIKGVFKIIKEEASSAGVRRVKAILV